MAFLISAQQKIQKIFWHQQKKHLVGLTKSLDTFIQYTNGVLLLFSFSPSSLLTDVCSGKKSQPLTHFPS